MTIDQLNKDYFALPKVSKYVKTIYLPATGCCYNQDGSGSGFERGSKGYYYSNARYMGHDAYVVSFDSTQVRISRYLEMTNLCAVRPFRNL